MPPDVGYATAALLLALAAKRGVEAFRVLRYQRNLRRLRKYSLPAGKIPLSRAKLFLGRGFRWTQTHTQRLRDTQRPWARPYVEPGPLYRWARRAETRWENRWLLGRLSKILSRDAWWNPVAPPPPAGGKPVLHGVEPDEHEVWMDLRERVGHTLVLGTTRVGKTRLAEILISQDIRRGDVVLVIDPKGDADLMRRVVVEARRAHRENELYLFHLGYPQISARYNPIGDFSRITEVATRIANQLPDQGNSAAFREFAWRFTNIVSRALHAMGRKPDYRQITRHITHIDPLLVEYCRQWLPTVAPEGWEQEVARRAGEVNDRNLPLALRGRPPEIVALVQYIKEEGFYDPIADGLRSAFEYDKTYFDKIVASLLPLMEKLISGPTADLIAPDYADTGDPRPIFDWMNVIRRQGIVYIGLDALSDLAVASAVGNSMFADLVSVAGQLYKHGAETGLPGSEVALKPPAVSLHADEFNELVGDEFIPLLNKAGGAGFQVNAYTQTWSDIEARIGSRAKAGQVAGNFNTLIMLRVKELATAEMLTNQLETVQIHSLMQVSGVSDADGPGTGHHFTSTNEDRLSVTETPLLSPADVMALPKGHAFALLEGGHLWKVRMPLPDPSGDPSMPESVQTIAREMEERYASGDPWWQTA
ncbi:MAG: type IV conjugative transfer system coupling protein TraD [Blastocatellia bacterium]